MNWIYYVMVLVVFVVMLYLAWPLLLGLILFLLIRYAYARWHLFRAQKEHENQIRHEATLEKRQSGLDIIDVEYEEKHNE